MSEYAYQIPIDLTQILTNSKYLDTQTGDTLSAIVKALISLQLVIDHYDNDNDGQRGGRAQFQSGPFVGVCLIVWRKRRLRLGLCSSQIKSSARI